MIESLSALLEANDLSLSELAAIILDDEALLQKLETDRHPNPSMVTLVRYAQAVGKRLVVTLADAKS
jgi:transcriptional regulator with XRE-family HTH domain